MEKKIFCFITFLRALAALIITNSHYVGVYPTDLIANGGLLGDVLFFSISGFCLVNPRLSFKDWIIKRWLRIYIVVWVITIVYSLIGAYEVNSFIDFVKWFIHPTKYHFVASITLLYIPTYFVARYIELNVKNWSLTALFLLLLQVFIYICFYDKSYYHIDNVRQPMIVFLWAQTMLLGLHFRWRSDNDIKLKWGGIKYIVLFIMITLYFASKMLFVKMTTLSPFQIVNQIILYVTLFTIFDVFQCAESKFQMLKGRKKVWMIVQWLSDHTLEIYCVQYVIIGFFTHIWTKDMFPINWLCITCSILVAAGLLRWVSQYIIKKCKI